MRNRQSRILDTLRHVQGYLDDHAATIGPSIAPSRRSLDGVEGELNGLAEAQASGTRNTWGETNKQRALRAALRMTHMRPIAEVARQKLSDVPEFSALTMPPLGATSTQLVTHATAMRDAAAVHEQVFRDMGLPDDFLAAFKAAADALTASVDRRNDEAGRRAGATAGLSALEKRAASVIRLLDAIVRPKLGSDAALIREWEAAKRIPRKRGGANDAAQTPTSPATPPAMTPPATTPLATTPPATQPAASTTAATSV